jgi:hypothetical protein
MTTMSSIESIIIILLLAYIVYLQIQLSKRNIFIETTVRKLSGIEKNRSLEDMMLFLKELSKTGFYPPAAPDKFLEESTTEFILENDEKLRIFMHYTRDEADAMSILKKGFRFANYFHKTALPVTRDKLDMIIKHNSQKYYGHFLVVLTVSDETVSRFTADIKKAGLKNVSFENIITESPVFKNENGEPVYTLPNYYVKGYVNHITGEITRNPDYNPYYISDTFEKNLMTFK